MVKSAWRTLRGLATCMTEGAIVVSYAPCSESENPEISSDVDEFALDTEGR